MSCQRDLRGGVEESRSDEPLRPPSFDRWECDQWVQSGEVATIFLANMGKILMILGCHSGKTDILKELHYMIYHDITSSYLSTLPACLGVPDVRR